MPHKIRKVMNDRYRLSRLVEVDEGYVGGEEHGEGRHGRGAGTKSVVAVAVERRGPGKADNKPAPGFAALEVISDATTETLEKFLADKVKPGSHILSDGWAGYRRLKQKGFEHTTTALSKQEQPAHVLFPAEIRSIVGGWVHQGQERDPLGPDVWGTKTELCGPALLGARASGIDSRPG